MKSLFRSLNFTPSNLILKTSIYSFKRLNFTSLITPKDIDPVEPNKNYEFPDYMKNWYDIWYIKPNSIKKLDREWVVNLILLGQAKKLESEVINEIKTIKTNNTQSASSNNKQVLMNGACYGNLIPKIINTLENYQDSSGGLKNYFLDIVDICPAIIKKMSDKVPLKSLPNTRLRVGDAQSPILDFEKGQLYDAALSFLLLHEVPTSYKYNIVTEMLKSVRPGGKVIFIDYHKPSWPILFPYLWLVFRIFEPFGFLLFRKEIYQLVLDKDKDLIDKFEWKKETYFFNTFQKVVATRKMDNE